MPCLNSRRGIEKCASSFISDSFELSYSNWPRRDSRTLRMSDEFSAKREIAKNFA